MLAIGDLNDDGNVTGADLQDLLTKLKNSSSTPPSLLKGDFNQDGHVNAADILAGMQALTNLNAYQNKYGLSNTELLVIGDVNGDGKVDDSDIQKLLNLLKSGGGSGSASGSGSLSVEVELSSVSKGSDNQNQIVTDAGRTALADLLIVSKGLDLFGRVNVLSKGRLSNSAYTAPVSVNVLAGTGTHIDEDLRNNNVVLGGSRNDTIYR